MLTHNNKTYARVSEVLADVSDYSHIPASVLHRKQNVGTCVHDSIEDFIKGDFPHFGTQENFLYFESFQRWYDTLQPRFVQTETRYYDDELMLTGCVDGIAYLPWNTYPTLIDFKTAATESPAWIMQAHLYYHLITNVGGMPVSPTFLFLKLSKNGTLPKVYTYKYSPMIMNACFELTRAYWERMDKCRLIVDSNESVIV